MAARRGVYGGSRYQIPVTKANRTAWEGPGRVSPQRALQEFAAHSPSPQLSHSPTYATKGMRSALGQRICTPRTSPERRAAWYQVVVIS